MWLLPLAVPLAGWVTLGKLTPLGLSLFYLQNGMPRQINEITPDLRVFLWSLLPSSPFLWSEEELCHPTGAGYLRLQRGNRNLSSTSACPGQDQDQDQAFDMLSPHPNPRKQRGPLCPQAGFDMTDDTG